MSPLAAPMGTVLVVDDEPAIVRLCRLILEGEGGTVLSASGSSDALKICKHHPDPIDVLVTDLVLPAPEFSFASGDNEFPHVHGHELAVRALRMRDTLRVVLMSGNIEKDLSGYGIRLGNVPVLSKPFVNQALIDRVRHALQSPPVTYEELMKPPPPRAGALDEWAD